MRGTHLVEAFNALRGGATDGGVFLHGVFQTEATPVGGGGLGWNSHSNTPDSMYIGVIGWHGASTLTFHSLWVEWHRFKSGSFLQMG